MEKQKQKIVFFLQTKKPIGGSQVLFLDLASYISNNFSDKYDVYYINCSNPIVNELYGSSNINFCDINCDYSQFENAVFFTPFNYVFYIMSHLRQIKSAKICFYFYHPQIFDWLGMQILSAKPNFEPFLQLLQRTHGCCFMDSSNLISANRLCETKFEPDYVPVTLHSTNGVFKKCSATCKDRIRIGWLGRLDYDKIYSVLNLADNLIALEQPKPIDLYVIGDGNAKSLIKLSKYCPQIRFIFTSYMYGEERDAFLRKNIDIVVAMGISAIDVALQGIPTLVPLVSGTQFRDDKFYYLFDTTGFSLGWNPHDAESIGCKATNFEKVIKDIYEDGKKQAYGDVCREFAVKEFSLARGVALFLSAIEKTTLTVEDCMKCGMISRNINGFRLYCAIRHRHNYEDFHEFSARIKRINKTRGITKKLKRIKAELKRTFSKRK